MYKPEIQDAHQSATAAGVERCSLAAKAGDVISIGSSGSNEEHFPALHQPAGTTSRGQILPTTKLKRCFQDGS
jgi:ABC-type histidine transport system ATPase subunit